MTPQAHKVTSFPLRMVTFNALFYVCGGSFPQILNFFLLPIYSRLLTPHDFGILGYVASISAFITITNCLSLNSYYLRYYFQAEDKKEFTGTLHYFLILSNFLFVLLEALLLSAVFPYFNIKVPFYPYMFLGLAECFFTGFSIIPLRFFRLEFRAGTYVSCSLAQVLLTQGLSLYLIYFQKMGAEGRLLGGALSAGIMAIFYLLSSRVYARITINRGIVAQGLRFSIPLMFGACADTILSISDRVILERFVPISSLGIYSIAFTLASAAMLIIRAFSFVVEPMVYKVADSPTFLADYLRLKDYFLFVVLVVVSAIIIFAREIVDIFLTPSFSQAANLLPIIAFSSVFLAARDNLGLLLMLKARTFSISTISLISAILNIILNLIFIPIYGIYAAAGTSVFSCLVSFILAFLISRTEMKASLNIGKDLLSLFVLLLTAVGVFAINPLVLADRVVAKLVLFALFCAFLCWNYSLNLKLLRGEVLELGGPS